MADYTNSEEKKKKLFKILKSSIKDGSLISASISVRKQFLFLILRYSLCVSTNIMRLEFYHFWWWQKNGGIWFWLKQKKFITIWKRKNEYYFNIYFAILTKIFFEILLLYDMRFNNYSIEVSYKLDLYKHRLFFTLFRQRVMKWKRKQTPAWSKVTHTVSRPSEISN